MAGPEVTQSGSDLVFELAVGTYGDLLHWMANGWIDVGILTAGVLFECIGER